MHWTYPISEILGESNSRSEIGYLLKVRLISKGSATERSNNNCFKSRFNYDR